MPVDGETTIEHRYYISSSDGTASKLLSGSEAHWGIENSLHWRSLNALDESRIRKGPGG